MNDVELLSKQTENAYHWVNKLIDPIPYEKWDNAPEVIETSITWQVGHLILSFYYHTMAVITGHQKDILEKVPLKEYNDLFGIGSSLKRATKTDPETLKNRLVLMEQRSLDTIRSLSSKELQNDLESTRMPHPVAKNKFEALDWNIKHTMWHCGQIAILKRVVDERFDFGWKIES
ncbi:MAG TPA: DinB family protein [Cyclobacteriaceae bacterium]|nr:DinB family protein [Cyclobacteriaceae bacterium]